MSHAAADFDAAVHFIAHYKAPPGVAFDLSNDVKLRYYGIYKQATEGPCTSAAPSAWNMVARAKHDAWASHGNQSRDAAKAEYVEQLTAAKPDWRRWEGVRHMLASAPPTPASPPVASPPAAASQPLPPPPPPPPAAGTPATERGMYDDFTARSVARSVGTGERSVTWRDGGGSGGGGTDPAPGPESPSAASRRDDAPATAPSTILTTSPMLPSDDYYGSGSGGGGGGGGGGGIRWSSSPNFARRISTAVTAVGDRGGDDDGGEDVDEGGAAARATEATLASTADALEARLSAHQLSRLCAELQLQVARQQALLASAQESLEYYIGALRAAPASALGSPALLPLPPPPPSLLEQQRREPSAWTLPAALDMLAVWARPLLARAAPMATEVASVLGLAPAGTPPLTPGRRRRASLLLVACAVIMLLLVSARRGRRA